VSLNTTPGFAALPPDVRKASGLPEGICRNWGCALSWSKRGAEPLIIVRMPRKVRDFPHIRGQSRIQAVYLRGSKQFRFVHNLTLRFGHAHPVDGILQHAGLDMTQGGDLARGAIGRFLDYVACVAFQPVPINLMTL
jgi:hypothetical protein